MSTYASESSTAAAMEPLKKRLLVKSSIRSRKYRNSLREMLEVVTSRHVPTISFPQTTVMTPASVPASTGALREASYVCQLYVTASLRFVSVGRKTVMVLSGTSVT